jgi:hypothetical protein
VAVRAFARVRGMTRGLLVVAACASFGTVAVAFGKVPGGGSVAAVPMIEGACLYVEPGGPPHVQSVSEGLLACDLTESDPVSEAGIGLAVGAQPVRGVVCLYLQPGGPPHVLAVSSALAGCDLAQSDPVSAAGLAPPVGPRPVRVRACIYLESSTPPALVAALDGLIMACDPTLDW